MKARVVRSMTMMSTYRLMSLNIPPDTTSRLPITDTLCPDLANLAFMEGPEPPHRVLLSYVLTHVVTLFDACTVDDDPVQKSLECA